MNIGEILRSKGSTVVVINPSATVHDLIAVLHEHNLGAVVVSEDGKTVAGIVSERDIIHRLATGSGVVSAPVESIMTTDVHTCEPSADVRALAALMTEHRIRHVPVVVDGVLRGIVSIGDVVKSRLDQLQFERDQLEGYVSG